MQNEPGIGAQFADIARRHPDFPAMVLGGVMVDYRQFWRIVQAFARRMRGLGIDGQSVVALHTSDALVSVATLLASSLLGAQFVIAGANLARVKALKPTHFLRSLETTEGRKLKFHPIDESWQPSLDGATEFDTGEFGPVDLTRPWLAQHTSGSTGVPKYLSLSQRIVLDRTRAIAGDFPKMTTTVAMLFACTSRPFQARAIGALLHCCTIVIGNDIGLWRKWGVNYVCGSPLQVADRFREITPGRKFRRVETSGGRLTDADALVMLAHFDTVIDVYGASETNKSFITLVTQNPDGSIRRTGRKLDSEIEIVDRDGQPVGPGGSGLVRVRNPYLVSGYVDEPEKTALSFRDGWFHPGDIGTWTADGALEILGREDDLLSIGGVKIYAGLIDMIMSTVPGVQEAICFKNPKAGAVEQLLAFVRFDKLVNRSECIEAIRQAIQDRFGVVLSIGNVHEINKIPRDENGKPQRALAQKMILEKAALRAAERAADEARQAAEAAADPTAS